MKSQFLHNRTETGFMIFFTMTLQPFLKYHLAPRFPSRIVKNAKTHPPAMCDIIEQPLYYLKIVLSIPLYNLIPCLFQLNFVFLLPEYIFL